MQENGTPQQFITKEIAAEMLNLSPRRVLELAKSGKIRQEESYNPETKRRQTVLSTEDVQKLANERQAVPGNPFLNSIPVPQLPAIIHTEMTTSRIPQNPLVRRIDPPQPAALPHPAQWLTLKQAAEYTGLPESALKQLIEDERLPALDVGPRPGGKWRISRGRLDTL